MRRGGGTSGGSPSPLAAPPAVSSGCFGGSLVPLVVLASTSIGTGGHDLKMIRPLPTGWPGGGAFAFGCRAGGCGGAGGGAPWSEAVLSCSSGVSILNFFSVASSFTPTLPSRSVLKSSLASSVRSIALMTSPFL